MSAAADLQMTCGLCMGDADKMTARLDKDIETYVCPDCLVQLRWAQARLKEQGICGVTRQLTPDATGGQS